jgi:hypothetical protein
MRAWCTLPQAQTAWADAQEARKRRQQWQYDRQVQPKIARLRAAIPDAHRWTIEPTAPIVVPCGSDE